MDEKKRALMEAHEIAASNEYFSARPQIDTNDRRKVFEAGFRKAWHECKESVDRLTAATELKAKQAEDDGLWFEATMVTEAHLQNALRELAAAIETPNAKVSGPEADSSPGVRVHGPVGPHTQEE